MTGRVVSHYAVGGKLGGGGMGVVYSAVDTLLQRRLALKFLPSDLSRDEAAKKRFVQEAQAASALDHPHICTIHEIGETESGQLFIAMAHYEGETLKSKIKRGPMDPAKVLKYALQIADGLACAHQAGIVHRDIKPANVMVSERDEVKILDFGIAKMLGSNLTMTSARLGTISYMSPEQARGEAVDQRTDVWSLGVVMYELLTGSRPFQAQFDQAVVYSILNTDPPALSDQRSNLPGALEAIVTRCLQKDPADRYQSMEDLVADLQDELQPRASETVPVRGVLWGAGVSVALVVMAAMWFFYPGESIAFQERGWLFITDFENRTGEEVFDESLAAALNVSIGQSRYVNVFPEDRTANVLERMRRPRDTHIDASLGLEIAKREGLPIVLIPEISRVGDDYALTAELRDAESGNSLHSGIVLAEGKDEVLDALDELTRNVRRELGENAESIQRQSEPLIRVTTASLDALRHFALGRQKLVDTEFERAKFHFERALEIDSSFTSARASLGMMHVDFSRFSWTEAFDRETGRSLISQAVREVEGLTPLERYSVLAFHAQAVDGDMERAASYYQALLDLYPDRSAAHNNLGRIHELEGRYEAAARSYREALRLNPDVILTRNGLVMIYSHKTGRIDSALAIAARHVERNPSYSFAHSLLGYAYIGADSLEEARAAIERALELNPESGHDLFRLARIHWMEGRMSEAEEAIKRAIEVSDGGWATYWLALLYDRTERSGQAAEAAAEFEDIVETWVADYSDQGMTYIGRGLLLTLQGEDAEGWETAQRALDVDDDPQVYLGLARVASAQGRFDEAISILEDGIENGFTNFIWMKIHPDLEPLYDHPGFQDLLERHIKV